MSAPAQDAPTDDRAPRRTHTTLWGLAFRCSGVADLLTTLLALHLGAVVEASPADRILVTQFVAWVMVPLKLGLLVGFYGLWYVITPL